MDKNIISNRLYNRMFLILAGILCFDTMQVSICTAITEDFSRYQKIIDRQPFGVVMIDSSQQTNAPVAAGDLFTKTLKMVAIKLDRNGKIRVGFINLAGNKSYYLSVGEVSNDGIEVLDADFQMEAALLKKDGQLGHIYMNGSQLKSSGVPDELVAMANASAPSLSSKSKKVMGYFDRMNKRMEDRKKEIDRKIAETPLLTPEELETHLNNYQMEVIRQGLPALPIPLTKEMDDQLVAEGVLQPLAPGQPVDVGQQ